MSAEDEVVDEAPEAEETEQQDDVTERAKADREAARKLRSEAANLRKRLKELEAERDAATKSEVEKAREAGKAEARAEVLKDRALDRVETRAAKTFADPEDARLQLAPKVEELIGDGEIDNDAIDKALAELLKRKPHLGVDQRRFKGSADGGARDGGNNAGKLTRADVQRLMAEGKHAEVTKAQDEGRIDWESARKR